ncbi:MAG: hypothetical protein ACLGIN_07815 [Candidatus Sericytochromatia bacterium]
MRCQACEKNEADTAVICGSCREHYAAIREGQFQEREMELGEARLKIRSWVAVAAPAEKKKIRDEKAAAKKQGFFGRPAPAVAAPVEEEAPPPPDWKNRVFPVPDPVEAPVADAPEASPENAAYDHQETFSYTGQLPPIDPPAAEEAAPAPLELGASTDPEETVLELGSPAAEPGPIELSAQPEPAPIELSPPPATGTLEATVPQAVEPEAPGLSAFFEAIAPAEDTVDAPDFSSFFEVAPEPSAPEQPSEQATAEPLSLPVEMPPAAPAPVEPVPAPALVQAEPPAPSAPAVDLSSLFSDLAAPAAPPEPAPPAAPAVQSDLSGFLSSLAQPEAPAAPAAEAPAAPKVDLSNFFASLSSPAPAPAAEPAPAEAAPAPVDLGDFLAGLGQPAPTAPTEAAAPPTAPVEEAAPTLVEPPAPVFEAPPSEPAPPIRSEAAFTIELDLPITPQARAAEAPVRQNPAELAPPTHGQPFTIDLGGPPEPPAPKANPETSELKKKLSMGGLSFVSDEEEAEAPTGGSLFDGLSFSGNDDDEDERTIEL